MARKPRIEFEGACFHVIARGNRRAEIFHDAQDYETYLGRLEQYRRRNGARLYAYVLMANHVHLLLETGTVPLARTMQTLQFTYSQYYNRRYGTTGHVFQGRYRAILCDRDAYLVELIRYLHLNPARLRHALNPWQYPWSSHRAYLGAAGPVQVHTGLVLEQWHRQLGPARRAYRRFLKAGLTQGHNEKFYETVDQRVLGDERFIRTVVERVTEGEKLPVAPTRVAFGALVTAVAQCHGVTPRALLAPGRQRALVPARAMAVWMARAWGGLSGREVARRFHRDPAVISRLCATYQTQRDLQLEARLREALSQ
jgi:REP element-mobilizing transposase RayT